MTSDRAVRVVLGAYVVVHYAALVPWGTELFSSAGILPDGTLSPLFRLVPNVLILADGPVAVTALLVLATGAATCLLAGVADRVAACVLWYVGACLLGRNPLIANPSLPFVGWLLLAHACTPGGSAGAPMRAQLRLAGGLLLAVGYSYSGIAKLDSPSWVDGSALARLLDNPLARPGLLRGALQAMPPVLLVAGTWAALGLEIACAPLALAPRLRPWLWLATTGLQVGVLLMLDFADLTGGMLVMHVAVFDPAWMPSPSAPGPAPA